MISIARKAVTDHFGINFRAARLCTFVLFKDENTGAFTHDKSVAILVKRTTCPLRIIVTGRKRFHGIEPGNRQRSDRRLGTAGNHRISIAPTDDMISFTDRVCPGCTSRDGREVGAFGAIADGNLSGGEVDDQHRNKEGRHLLVTAFVEGFVVFFNGRQAAKAGTDQDTDPLGILFINHQRRIFHRHIRCCQRILDKEIHLLDLFFIDKLFGVKIFDFTGYLGWKIRGIKAGYAVNTGLTL